MFLLPQIQYKALMNWGFNPRLTASAPPPYRSSHSVCSLKALQQNSEPLKQVVVHVNVYNTCKSSHLQVFFINSELGGVIMHSFDVVI